MSEFMGWWGQRLARVLLPLIVLLPLLWVYVPGGLPLTADSRVHFVRSAEMVHAWADGVLLPRWSANLGGGLGIPLFNYAPPLPYLTTAAFHVLGLELEPAFKAMHVLALLIFAGGAYQVAAAPLGRWPGLVAAAAMLYAPVVLRELYIQGNVGQLMAWAFVPWTLYGVQAVFARPGWRSGALLALAFAGALLSHNAVALLLAEVVAVQVLWLAIWLRQGRGLLVAGGALALGLALTAWFWAPALFEGDYIQLDKIVASSYRDRFLSVGELVAWLPRLDLRSLNPYVPLTLGAPQVLLALLGGLALLATMVVDARARRTAAADARAPLPLPLAGYYALLALFGAAMALPISQPLWARLPFMDLLEFPFRWHGFTLVALGWLAGFAIAALARRWPAAAPVAATLALAALLAAALPALYPPRQAPGLWAWSPAEIVRYEARSGAVGTTSLGEFNPVWATAPILATSPFVDAYPADGHPPRLRAPLPAGVTATQTGAGVQQLAFTISAATPATLTLDLLYFPGWRATGAVLTPAAESGLMQLAVPAGVDQQITLRYAGTMLERVAGWFSALAWLLAVLALGGLAGRAAQRWRPGRGAPAPAAWRPLLAALGVVAGVLVLREAAPARFQYTSPPGQTQVAALPVTATFGGAVRVIGLEPPPTTVRGGETLATTVYLETTRALPVDYGLFLHLDRPDGVTVAAVDVQHPSDIPMRTWPAGFYVRAPLRLTVPVDALPLRYTVNLGVVDPATGEWLALDSGGDVLALGQLWIEPPAAPPRPAGSGAPVARFGDVLLLDAQLAADRSLTLHWRAEAPIARRLSIFVHYVDAAGTLLGQQDGVPYAGLHPPDAWQPGQVVTDRRTLPAGIDPAQVAAVRVGVYDLDSTARLPGVDPQGVPLADDAFVLRP